MAIDLSNLDAPKPNQKNKKRIGRGQGTGKGGHTVGRGHNGQRARSGFKVRFWFEGGQMPLQRRIPKFGFINRFRTEYVPLNVDRLAALLEEGRLGETVTIENLRESGFLAKDELVKLLGDGEIDAKVDIEVHACSDSARKKVEEAGGSVTVTED
ncbi:MAG: 50S ribosomal protein L15 [Balneolaceae bacterium]|nr:50S ribosomal protein L15 [Balneolaceae bacterium]